MTWVTNVLCLLSCLLKGLKMQCLQHVVAHEIEERVVSVSLDSPRFVPSCFDGFQPAAFDPEDATRMRSQCQTRKTRSTSLQHLHDEQRLEGKQGLASDVQQIGHNVVPW